MGVSWVAQIHRLGIFNRLIRKTTRLLFSVIPPPTAANVLSLESDVLHLHRSKYSALSAPPNLQYRKVSSVACIYGRSTSSLNLSSSPICRSVLFRHFYFIFVFIRLLLSFIMERIHMEKRRNIVKGLDCMSLSISGTDGSENAFPHCSCNISVHEMVERLIFLIQRHGGSLSLLSE
jgi:hypothetical protein